MKVAPAEAAPAMAAFTVLQQPAVVVLLSARADALHQSTTPAALSMSDDR